MFLQLITVTDYLVETGQPPGARWGSIRLFLRWSESLFQSSCHALGSDLGWSLGNQQQSCDCCGQSTGSFGSWYDPGASSMPVEEQVSEKPLQTKKNSRKLHQGFNIHATFWARRFFICLTTDLIINCTRMTWVFKSGASGHLQLMFPAQCFQVPALCHVVHFLFQVLWFHPLWHPALDLGWLWSGLEEAQVPAGPPGHL